ncbi:hypothetical protein F5Y15DRAFT_309732 [Xylariaceae sp. FL0016]|nr:hypothetical protein F5Y15DRAFT_309732 [Xylariaceae sp. FL0016]
MCWSRSTTGHIEIHQNSREYLEAFDVPDTPTPTSLQASRDGIDLHPYRKDLVKDYTRRNLTSARDRLSALSGLASKPQALHDDDEYLAGLRRSTLDQSLPWSADLSAPFGCMKHRIDIIPSWSGGSFLFMMSGM